KFATTAGFHEHVVVLLDLVRIRGRILRQRLAELIATADIRTDLDSLTARLRMGSRHDPSAQLRVTQQQVVVDQLDVRREFHVTQWPEIKMPARRTGFPAEENIAG